MRWLTGSFGSFAWGPRYGAVLARPCGDAGTATEAGVRRRFAPHQLVTRTPVEKAHEDVPLIVIQRQLGHSNLGSTSVYLQGIDNAEIIKIVHGRPSADGARQRDAPAPTRDHSGAARHAKRQPRPNGSCSAAHRLT
jgi:hypothetical protein